MHAKGFGRLLVWTVAGTYLLVALGATSTVVDGHVAVVATHYAVAVAVGFALVAAAAAAWLGSHARRVRGGITAALAGYVVQSLVGLAGVGGWTPLDGRLHLYGGVAVFATLLLTLVWELDGVSTRDTDGAAADGSQPQSRPPAGSGSDEASPPAAATASQSDATGERLLDRARAYVALTKPRLMWLLCLLALAGMGLATATGGTLDGTTVVVTLAGGVLAIGASGTFNHVYERDRDRRMDRTADRPVATSRVDPRAATAFGLGLTAASLALLIAFVNALAAVLTLAAILYYAVGYTVLLKPTTQWNTVVGGGAGALPAVIGYVAVTGAVGAPAVVLAALVFCWTPAHFYNLAIARREEYARAAFPMLPVVQGVAVTRRRIVYWLGATLIVAAVLGGVADLGPLYAVVSAGVGAVFVASVVRQWRRDTDAAALRTFHVSNAYLGCVLGAILVETVVL